MEFLVKLHGELSQAGRIRGQTRIGVPDVTAIDLFLWGCMGGIVDEVLHWGSLRRRAAFPTYVRKTRYWVITAALVAVGGVVALASGLSATLAATPLTALVTGFSAPALIKKLSKALLSRLPELGSAGAEPSPSLRAFLQD